MQKKTRTFACNIPMDRRSFIKLSAFAGLGIASTCCIPSGAEAVKIDRRMYKVSQTKLAMGTFVSMTLIHPSKTEAEDAMGKAFEEIARIEKIMTRFDDSAEVAQLNKNGYIEDSSPEVCDVVGKSLDYYRMSGGVFDISVKPLLDIFDDPNVNRGKFPKPTEIKRVMSLIGADMIRTKGRSIYFGRHGMGITLDGIAKGYIVDRASDVLTNNNIEHHLINAGGDIRVKGTKGRKKPWVIAIQDPHKRGRFPDIIKMTDGAIATSGNYEVHFAKDSMFRHIVSPKTGLAADTDTSVSIVSNTTMDADALSTTVFLMDPAKGTRFIDALPGRECLVLDTKNRMFKSSGWKRHTRRQA